MKEFLPRLMCLAVVSIAASAKSSDAQGTGGPIAAETFRVRIPSTGLSVFVRHQAPTRSGGGDGKSPVLFVHGSSFPSALAFAYKFDGVSWMDDLAGRGFDVWAFDFLGYGGSDRYPEMRDSATANPPLGRAPVAAAQIAAVVDFIRSRTKAQRASIIAHSWGTIPAGLFAGQRPEAIDRLVDFGPVAQRPGNHSDAPLPAYDFVSEKDQLTRFDGYVPNGEAHVLAEPGLPRWGPTYMTTDSTSRSRNPASVKIPNGPSADVADAWSGRLPYDPSLITAPVLIVRGDWDVVTKDADAAWLWSALRHARVKRDVKIARGTHVMHLERNRAALFDEVGTFLSAPLPRR